MLYTEQYDLAMRNSREMAKRTQMVLRFLADTYTVVPWYLSAAELSKPDTHHILMRKSVSALSACSPLTALASTCMNHDATP